MTYPLTTTLNRIWAQNLCDAGKERGLTAAGKTAPDDEPITFAAIANAVGLADALWCCRAEPQYSREWRLYAVWCARQVQHLLTDARSLAALDVAERYANGIATNQELAAARDAAGDAAWGSAWAAAGDAAGDAAGGAAWAAAWAAAGAAVWAAAGGAAQAVAADAAWGSAGKPSQDAVDAATGGAAWAASWSAAWDAAFGATRDAQLAAFLQLVTTGTLPAVQSQEVAA